jgi:hypothetical protein
MLLVAVLGFSSLAHATLTVCGTDGSGNQFIYDSDLNITWYDYNPGRMLGSAAVSWASNLTVGGVSGWTLPTTLPVNGSTYNYNQSYDGSTDSGYSISAPGSAYPGTTASEMAYLFYVELGNKPTWDINGNSQGGGLANKGPFKNLRGSLYWSSTGADGYLWCFYFSAGGQAWSAAGNGGYALAVHPGEVLGDGVVLPHGPVPTPLPAAALLFAPGLAGLAVLKRRKGRANG